YYMLPRPPRPPLFPYTTLFRSDSRIKFCLLTLTGAARPADEAEFVFFALDTSEVRDPEKRFTLTPEEIALLNPNTKTCPIFRTRSEEHTSELQSRENLVCRLLL